MTRKAKRCPIHGEPGNKKTLPASMKLESLGFCPCGGMFYFSAEHFALAHDEPMCSEFETLWPDEFLAYVRKHREAHPDVLSQ